MSAHGPTLEVDLDAVARNYGRLRAEIQQSNPAAGCASVVKADAYGLGAIPVASALYAAGCRTFFVATLDEAIRLRPAIADAELYVFHGARAEEQAEFRAHRLRPVVNSPAQATLWGENGPYALHVDTGMCRLGFSASELENAVLPPYLRLLMSHLACAGEPDHPKNAVQLALFRAARQYFPEVPASLANSSGIYLGTDYHFDLGRPGCSLYGISPDTSRANPLENVVTLSAPVLQYRTITQDETVGYSATVTAKAGSVIATVELGYADGFLRSLSGKAFATAHGYRLPLLGRVSMDMVSIDVTALPDALRTTDLRLTFIGEDCPVDEAATQAGTIGYELFTRIGPRVQRIYRQTIS
jgi:alanine racemase